MSNNGHILDLHGQHAARPFEPPTGSNPFFGWMDSMGGFVTIRVESIIALVPEGRTGRFQAVLTTGQPIVLPAEDGLRLMRRMGWKETSAIARA